MSPGARKTPPPSLLGAHVPLGVLEVLERLQEAGHEAYLVGGCVRDLVAGREPHDWDVATQAVPAQVQGLFPKVIPTGIAHGTVTVLIPGGQLEVTTYRVEAGYADGRRPDRVEFRRDLVEDLARRDFTINAMAFNPRTGELRDPFGGLDDLSRRMVRVRCGRCALPRCSSSTSTQPPRRPSPGRSMCSARWPRSECAMSS